MKYANIINAVFSQPWLITSTAHASIRQLVESRVLQPSAAREATGACGEDVEVEQMEIRDGVAIIPVGGVLGRKLSGFEKGAGAVDFNDIEDDLDEAESDDSVRGIIFTFDSPGGMVNGTEELADRILQCQKETMGWVPDQACSAAQWLLSACDLSFAAPSADVGSIGVYMPWVDQRRAFEMQGYDSDPITSGRYKAAGFPGTSLSSDQRAELQSRVDGIAARFKDHVKSMRGDVPDSLMQGQVITARDALAAGLIDGVFRSMEEASRAAFSRM